MQFTNDDVRTQWANKARRVELTKALFANLYILAKGQVPTTPIEPDAEKMRLAAQSFLMMEGVVMGLMGESRRATTRKAAYRLIFNHDRGGGNAGLFPAEAFLLGQLYDEASTRVELAVDGSIANVHKTASAWSYGCNSLQIAEAVAATMLGLDLMQTS